LPGISHLFHTLCKRL